LATEWLVPTAHNGILEVVLALGWIGGGLMIIDFLMNLYRSASTVSSRPTSLFAFGTMALFALFSVSESVFLLQNNLTWVTYVAVAAKLSLDARNRVRARAEQKERTRTARRPAMV
ncbi:MAG TPA: hypothetical protein DDY27_01860, partial [Hyphomonadaceae bacterium]|nr:hypothetical protein [Hyphomonadaceae bacterium]